MNLPSIPDEFNLDDAWRTGVGGVPETASSEWVCRCANELEQEFCGMPHGAAIEILNCLKNRLEARLLRIGRAAIVSRETGAESDPASC